MTTRPDKSHLVVTEQDGVTVVDFSESVILDAYHINEVSKELFSLIDMDGRSLIVLDFAVIKMISSQTLGVLLKMKNKLDKLNGKMAISGIDPRLYRVFKITNLQSVFDFFEDRESAVKSLQNG